MTASEKQENLLAEKNKVSSATTIAQKPRLMASNRLFGRLAGRTLEKLASKPKTSNELKREELGMFYFYMNYGSELHLELLEALHVHPKTLLIHLGISLDNAMQPS